MPVPVMEVAARPRATCPFCGQSMTYKGDGYYVCPGGCCDVYKHGQDDKQPQPMKALKAEHVSHPWPELAEGMPAHLKQGMIDIATLPLRCHEPGPCRGHGGKGGGGSKSGGKSQARQKLEAWVRKTSPGRRIRSIRIG